MPTLVLLEPGHRVVDADRPREQVALQIVDAKLRQRRCPLIGLDTLAYRLGPQRLGHRHHGRDEGAHVPVVDVGHEPRGRS